MYSPIACADAISTWFGVCFCLFVYPLQTEVWWPEDSTLTGLGIERE